MFLPLPISDKRTSSLVQAPPRAPKRPRVVRLPRCEEPAEHMPILWLPPAKAVPVRDLGESFWSWAEGFVDSDGMNSGSESSAKNSDENVSPNKNGAGGGSGNPSKDSDQQDKPDEHALHNHEGAGGDEDGDEDRKESAQEQMTAAVAPDEALCKTPPGSPRALKCPSRPNRGMPVPPPSDSDDELDDPTTDDTVQTANELLMMIDSEDDDDMQEMEHAEDPDMDVEGQGDPYASPPATPRDMQNAPGAPRREGKV